MKGMFDERGNVIKNGVLWGLPLSFDALDAAGQHHPVFVVGALCQHGLEPFKAYLMIDVVMVLQEPQTCPESSSSQPRNTVKSVAQRGGGMECPVGSL